MRISDWSSDVCSSDLKLLPFFSWLSADWQVRRDRWNDVALEVYYDAKHPYNVDRMIESAKKSLDYYTREFSPYQFRQLRILEFPSYARFAQAFAGTVPYSESIRSEEHTSELQSLMRLSYAVFFLKK